MQTGRGGMGMVKHRTSGTPGPNRRMLQALARFVNRMDAWRRRRVRARMYATVEELMRKEGGR
jgi:hypothetical protein